MYRDEAGYYYHVDRAVDAIDLGGGDWLYTAMSEERILRACPDVRDCTVVSARRGRPGGHRRAARRCTPRPTRTSTARERSAAALSDAAAATLRQVVVVADDQLVVGPTGKVRKFLMRQRHLAEMAAG